MSTDTLITNITVYSDTVTLGNYLLFGSIWKQLVALCSQAYYSLPLLVSIHKYKTLHLIVGKSYYMYILICKQN